MYLGTIVELTDTARPFGNPRHPYAQQLISAMPLPEPEIEKKRRRIRLKGELSSALDPRAGMRFLPSKLGVAGPGYVPKLQERFTGHFVAEHGAIEDLLA